MGRLLRVLVAGFVLGGACLRTAGAEELGSSRVIEEIIVTAQKRAENMQDVPIAISAFSGDELLARGVDDAQSLQIITPGLVYDSIGNFSVIYLRGVGTDAFIPSADLSVATYVDGVFLPFAFSIARSLGDVERVEVLKGPQGTLFGRNTTGGAINITTNDPSEELGGSLQLAIGPYQERIARLSLSGPLWGESLRAAVSGLYTEKSEYYEFTSESVIQDTQDYQEAAVGGKVLWQPWEPFQATLGGFYLDSQGPGSLLFAQLDPTDIGEALGVTAEDDYDIANNSPTFAFQESYAVHLTLDYVLRPFDLKLIGSHQEVYGQQTEDFDGSNADVVEFGGGEDHLFGDRKIDDPRSGLIGDVNTLELQVLSNEDTWWSDWVTWIGGLYYYEATSGFEPARFGVAGLHDLFEVNGQLPAPVDLSGLQSLFDVVNAAPLPDTGFGIEVNGLLDTESFAAFGQATIHALDWIDVTVGARYTKEKRRAYNSSVNALYSLDGMEVQAAPVFNYPEDETENDKFTPKVSLALHPWEGILLYGSWQKGFKSGSFNIINITTPPSLIRPETSTTAEVGFKSEWFDGRLRLNAAAFDTQIEDLQSQFISLLSGGVVSFENAQEASVIGADVDASWAIAGGLIANATFNVLDGVYDKFTDARGFDPETRQFNESNDFSGNTIVRNPDFTASIGLDYGLDVPGGELGLAGSMYHNSGYFYDPGHTAEQRAYEVFDARVSYIYDPFDVRLTVFGENLGGGKRYLFQFPTDFGTVGKLAPPRMVGARLDWRF